ncbi:MAG: ATP-dependent DNA helicase UvrD2 [bacterium]|nr:ATP-dependent DNA helicase UvrD2 [Acidimicrobiia bacterium]MCY4651239.1 ATP-dependent DNA helicase UvrD2 [bacterium]
MTFPGPDLLGRGAVVPPGGSAPLAGAERVVVDRRTLDSPTALEETVERLHRNWANRLPVTVELGVEASELRQPVVEDRAPWMLGPGYLPWLERLHFLVWANNWDARNGAPIWWWGHKAARLGARIGGRADIILPGGDHVWVDGGPRSPLDVPTVHSQTVEQGRLVVQPPAVASGSDLADDQRAAVEHPGGPVRVIAPAGSGKTRTLGARLLHLVDDRRIEPGIVTAVAYNHRAALQMRERLQRNDLHIRTIHSLGWAIIREVRPDATLLDERGVRARLRDMIRKRPQPNTDIIGPYLEGLAAIRIALRDPVAVEEDRSDVEGLAGIFTWYRSLIQRRNEVDYDEQIYGAVELLLADPQLRQRWQRRCRHLLVDEFQDLTPAYLLLLRLLSSPELSVFGVGDDDQTIYGYAGADPKFLIDFDQYFPGAGASALTINYRCPSEVVTAASRLLSYNRIRVPKTIEAAPRSDGGSFRIITSDRRQMAGDAEKEISSWLHEGVPPQRIAVLARVNSALLPVLAALDREGIPFVSQLDEGLLNRTTMRATLAWVRLALNTTSMRRTDLMEAVRRPARRINRLASELIPEGNTSLAGLAGLGGGLDDRKATTWRRFVNAIETAAKVARQGDSGVLLDYLSGEVGLGRVAHALDAKRGRADRSTHTDDLVALRRTAVSYRDLPAFESSLRQLLGRQRSSAPGVLATSIHRVKGLEWDRVIVFGVDAGLVPHLLTDDTEEERRVLHVAITRCRQQVVVLAEKGRESPFLPELTRTYRPITTRSPGHRLAPPTPAMTEAGVQPHRASDSQQSDGASDQESAAPYDAGLYETLRQWRLDIARQNNVAAFIVLYNRTLEEIARHRPGTEAELLEIKGIGPAKLSEYGQDLLRIVATQKAPRPQPPERADAKAPQTDPPPKPAAGPPPSETIPPANPDLLEALRQWRGDLARRNQVPPYTILNNRTLEEVSTVQPTTEAALLAIHGIGPQKLDRYGQDVLKLVRAHQPG